MRRGVRRAGVCGFAAALLLAAVDTVHAKRGRDRLRHCEKIRG